MSHLPEKPSRRRWIWFFAILGLMATGAIVIPIVYNLSLQLDPTKVLEAKQRWKEHGPSDYLLEMLVKHDRERDGDQYWIKVRAGRVVTVYQNGLPLLLDDHAGLLLGPYARSLPEDDYQQWGVEHLLEHIESLANRKNSEGKTNYATASFHPKDGHPLRFIYRVAGTKQRLEWTIKLTAENGP